MPKMGGLGGSRDGGRWWIWWGKDFFFSNPPKIGCLFFSTRWVFLKRNRGIWKKFNETMIMGDRAITFFKGRCFFIEKDIFLGITWRTCSEGMNDLNFVIFLPQECTVIWSVKVERSKQHHRFGGFLIPPSFFFSSFLLPFFFPNLLQIWQLWRFQSGNCFFCFLPAEKHDLLRKWTCNSLQILLALRR